MRSRSCMILVAGLAALGLIPGRAAEKPSAPPASEAGSVAEQKKDLQWAFTPDPKLPNVLILGDSISVGYTLEVRKRLAGKANVFRAMDKHGKKVMNCSGTTFGLERIDEWIGTQKWAVIHFNFGLHDLKHVNAATGHSSPRASDPEQATVATYTKNLETIVKKLKATGARLIFATTTPVPEGCNNPYRAPEAPARYNAAALAIMKTNGVRVNDLYAFALPHLGKIQQPKNVHFTDEGSRLLSEQVAAVIEAELKAP